MNKFLLALTILGAGAGVFHTARLSTTRLQDAAKAAREAWLVQSQWVAIARNDQAGLTERIRELKQALAQPPATAESPLWTALQTNRADRLPPEMRQQLLEELGFQWQSSEDYIVVTKQTLRDIHMQTLRGGKFTDVATTVLTLTPEECGQIEAAMHRVRTDFEDWTMAHVQRAEPQDDVVAQYTLPVDSALSQSFSNNFATGVFDALGRQRAELILPDAWNTCAPAIAKWNEPWTMIVKRDLSGGEPRLKVQFISSYGTPHWSGPSPRELSKQTFPSWFLPVFPNGWADVAKREGFELPEQPQGK